MDALHHSSMTEEIAQELFDQAVDLAYRAFDDQTTDDHIEWAYQRLVVNWQWGLGHDGAVTVH